MNLDQLKEEASKDLPIIDQEHLDQESYKNQVLKPNGWTTKPDLNFY